VNTYDKHYKVEGDWPDERWCSSSPPRITWHTNKHTKMFTIGRDYHSTIQGQIKLKVNTSFKNKKQTHLNSLACFQASWSTCSKPITSHYWGCELY